MLTSHEILNSLRVFRRDDEIGQGQAIIFFLLDSCDDERRNNCFYKIKKSSSLFIKLFIDNEHTREQKPQLHLAF